MSHRHAHLAAQVLHRYQWNMELRRASAQILATRTASAHKRLYRKWANPQVLHQVVVAAGFGAWLKGLPAKVKDALGDKALKAWEGVRGTLGRFVDLFKNPKIIEALSDFIGDVTPDNVKRFMEEGKKVALKVFGALRAVLVHPTGMPTLTDLLKRTAIGAGIADWFEAKVKPKADALDKWLKDNLPNLRRAAVAALFTFIWLNVDEISWDWPSLVAGFTGAMDLSDLIASIPESLIGLVTGKLWGIGFTIMPYMILGRIMWMASQKYLEWNGKEWVPNFNKVDRAAFK